MAYQQEENARSGVNPRNLHATAILLADRGVLIMGPSGSGKTTLGLALIDCFHRQGRFSRIVSDDQVLVETHAGRLICQAPASIAGLVEVAGIGPQPIIHEPRAAVDLCLSLVEGSVERFQEEASETIAGCRVPLLRLAARNVAAAVPMVIATQKFGIFA